VVSDLWFFTILGQLIPAMLQRALTKTDDEHQNKKACTITSRRRSSTTRAMFRALIVALLTYLGAAYTQNVSPNTASRRAWLGGAATVVAAAQPAFALRSVLDEESALLFEQRELERNKPPPPSKSLKVYFELVASQLHMLFSHGPVRNV
jgi:hypothetical protein